MKSITNWKNATVFDIEADSLLDAATKIHVLSFHMANGRKGSISGLEPDRIKAFFQYHLDNDIPVVAHNGICYDVPLVEKILEIDLSKLMVLDSLALSWYCFHDRMKHGLDSFFDDYGIAKPKILDEQWAGLSVEQLEFLNNCEDKKSEEYLTLKAEYDEHYALMLDRCTTDVDINRALWEDLKAHLIDMYKRAKVAIDHNLADGRRIKGEVCYIDQYKGVSTVDDYIDRILTFLNHKMDISRLKEKTRFKLDIEQTDKGIEELSVLIAAATKELEAVMPQVPKYTKKNKPKELYKKNGDLSVHGQKWNDLLDRIGEKDEQGHITVEVIDAEELKILHHYEPPNIDSVAQIKRFLFSKGWEPQTFKYEVDEEAMQEWVANGCKKGQRPEQRKIPQINKEGEDGKELCDSVVMLAQEVPEIMAYAKYTVIKHRYGVLVGFKENMSEDGYLKARNGGFTNTLREKHRELVNLPSAKKPYAEYIRSSLVSVMGEILCGSDLSSLEDRVKIHFMLAYDPEYCATMMADDYDPHLVSAVASGLITLDDMAYYKECKKTGNISDKPRYDKIGSARQLGKTSNYACVYGAGAEKISLSAKIALATAKQLHEGYWKLNWAVKAIGEDCCTITDSWGLKWLVNPINGFCYSIRSDKDRFSTLCQGTGSFFFDMWVDKFLEKMYAKWKVKRLSGCFHDELILSLKDHEGTKAAVQAMLKESINEVTQEYLLRRDLDCGVDFGKRYSEIH